jgi:hypothetical protein
LILPLSLTPAFPMASPLPLRPCLRHRRKHRRPWVRKGARLGRRFQSSTRGHHWCEPRRRASCCDAHTPPLCHPLHESFQGSSVPRYVSRLLSHPPLGLGRSTWWGREWGNNGVAPVGGAEWERERLERRETDEDRWGQAAGGGRLTGGKGEGCLWRQRGGEGRGLATKKREGEGVDIYGEGLQEEGDGQMRVGGGRTWVLAS